MSQQRSLIEEFIIESLEHITSVEDDFLSLEKHHNDPDKTIINKIFRSIHTIKGSAGFFGLNNINALSHRMETILTLLRDDKVKPDRRIIDLLLEGVDSLHALLNSIEHSDEMNIDTLCGKLDTVLAEYQKDQHAAAPPLVVAATDRLADFEISEATLQSLPQTHEFLYILQYDLCAYEMTTKKNVLELIDNLQQIGIIIDGILEPSVRDLHDTGSEKSLIVRFLYSSIIDPTLIAEAVELDRSSIRCMDRSGLAALKERAESSQPESDAQSPLPHAATADTRGVWNGKKPDDDLTETSVSASEIVRPGYDESAQKNNTTIRIRLEALDELMMLASELVLVRNQQLMHADRTDQMSRAITQKLDIVTTNLQEAVVRTRMQPVGTIFHRFSRLVRELAKKLDKLIEIDITGNEVELDKTILEKLSDPLTHIIRNCCDHGIESPQARREAGKAECGRITLAAFHESGQMHIEIFDDGKGVDIEAIKSKIVEKRLKSETEVASMSEKELLSLIFLPGFSTAATISDVSGRGVGLDVVKTVIENLNGIVEIKSARGVGTQFFLRLPLTLAIIPSLIVRTGTQRFAIPQVNLEELVCLYDEQVYTKIEYTGICEVYRLRNMLLPIVYLDEVLENSSLWTEKDKAQLVERHRIRQDSLCQQYRQECQSGSGNGRSLIFAVLKAGAMRFGLVIEGVIGTEEIVVKPMHRLLKKVQIYSGATVLGDGRVALILDVLGIARHVGIEFEQHHHTETIVDGENKNSQLRNFLLFKSGEEEHFAFDLAAIKRI
ncbi:MAG: chemotaxis protein CheA, partial [Chitinivibrionales bacterium]|nr:chemotaxis protein CheA [Chitinivibrionales bacterium]